MRLLEEGERRLARSAEAFTRAAAGVPDGTAARDGAPPAPEAPDDASAGLPDAAIDLIDGRMLGRTGALLLRKVRETEDAALDVLA